MSIQLDTIKNSKILIGLYHYKAHHLVFWFVYHYMWWAIGIGSAKEAAYNIFFSPYNVKFLFYFIFQAAAVYFNLYYLIPKFLEKRKYFTYLSFFSLTILITVLIITAGYFVAAYVSDTTLTELFGEQTFVSLLKSGPLSSTLASMTLAMSIKLTKKWIKSQQQQQLLEKEKIETELKFLKSQFNPHFLFNTINSIFVLIHKNPDMASESLASFSDLMRYQLYECNEAKIPLEKEIDYLHNFINLGKLRLDQTVKVTTSIKDQMYGDWSIAPFILMPFVENAFKHVSQGIDQKNWIDIKLHNTENEIIFEITNSINSYDNYTTEDLMKNNGIGLKNVQRRLDLIYKDQYDLDTKNTKELYRIALKLKLNSHSVSSEDVITSMATLQS
ncbi:GHKL domain-containing protein [Aquimarina sp. AD1]|uniref:sensor histidine kinase n=1 Tax=Aquimarina sp. (strain AD1) TaxID=1714848 RepID=UPI000E485923|nr:histidine kinase [Aquimarina sp. AD1]AXT54549.1 GHKL domain-containing protein [Aquimarina sp. AD1]RKN14874.1 GHKL domain-containing protein [Aquimarina sp. AD1]